MRISIFAGDVSDAPAEALCTSTNPRLSLVMGTGASIRGRGGFEILRACKAVVKAEFSRTGIHGLSAGSVHTTTAGQLPAKAVIHCVASDAAHRSSAAIIRSCVKNALAAADAAGCTSIAMPLFGTGHAHFKTDQALAAIADVARCLNQSAPRSTRRPRSRLRERCGSNHGAAHSAGNRQYPLRLRKLPRA
jgi:O-acetyl-ADP-ribose deacetylase (regulator of RNase III)